MEKIKKPKAVSKGQADQLINLLPLPHNLVVKVMIESGLRISDALELKVDNLEIVQEKKTRKLKELNLSEKLKGELYRYALINYGYVFRSTVDMEKHITRQSVYRQIIKASKKLNIKCSPHSFRKLYAMNLFKATKDIVKVQKALNHKYTHTTLDYLDIDLSKYISSHF